MLPQKKKGYWDMGLDFVGTLRRFKDDLKRLEIQKRYYEEVKNMPPPPHVRVNLAYTSILLIQLANGARISEAVEATYKFLEDGFREQEVRVRRKNRDEYRLIIIPREVKRSYLGALIDWEFRRVLQNIRVFTGAHYGFNTHSLRYAFINYAGTEKGLPPQLIARITRLSRLDMLSEREPSNRDLEKRAEEALRELAG